MRANRDYSWILGLAIVLLFIGAFVFIGLNAPEGAIAGKVQSGEKEYTRYCVDGVEYIKIDKGVAPYFRPDGTLHLCSEISEQEG